MVEVHLWSGLRRFTGGADKVDVPGRTVGELLDNIVAVHPGLAPVIAAGVSVSVDGEIIVAPRHEPVEEGSEVFLLQRLKGG
ncbi:MoaD/ThiS family protein [Shimia sp.]|uniref:MoaD/ThiS family protein n=1 Tax=Shimia sp. TaxID=1954381 RepID=UPI003563DF75